jgi:hypothetical protein
MSRMTLPDAVSPPSIDLERHLLSACAPRVVASVATTRTGLAPPPWLGARARCRVCRALPRTLESHAVNGKRVRRTRPSSILFVCGCTLRCTLIFRRADFPCRTLARTLDFRSNAPGSACLDRHAGVPSGDDYMRGEHGLCGDARVSDANVSTRPGAAYFSALRATGCCTRWIFSSVRCRCLRGPNIEQRTPWAQSRRKHQAFWN